MKLSRTIPAIAVVVSLNVLFALPVSAQTFFDLKDLVKDSTRTTDRAAEVMQDNEFVVTAAAVGEFYCNPLLLNGKPLNYNAFNIDSEGELKLVKGSALTGAPMQIPFYAYLRRNGTIIKLHGEEASKPQYMKIDLSTILKSALPDDQLIIEPINNEDWQAKRILKLMKGGC